MSPTADHAQPAMMRARCHRILHFYASEPGPAPRLCGADVARLLADLARAEGRADDDVIAQARALCGAGGLDEAALLHGLGARLTALFRMPAQHLLLVQMRCVCGVGGGR